MIDKFHKFVNDSRLDHINKTLGFALILTAIVSPFLTLWIFDMAATKYVETEMLLTSNQGLSNESRNNINQIQQIRFQTSKNVYENQDSFMWGLMGVGIVLYLSGVVIELWLINSKNQNHQ